MYYNNFNNGGGYYYPNQAQYQNYNQQPQRKSMKCYPVSNFDEVNASMIDFDGSVTVFTDFANGKIYTKQIDLNGMAVLKTYALQQNAEKLDLESRVSSLEEKLNSLSLGGIKDESTAIDSISDTTSWK